MIRFWIVALKLLDRPILFGTLRQSISNAGANSQTKVGYNVLTDEYVNMIDAGITDPVKVTRSAVANAASIAGMILTTESLISGEMEPATPVMPPGSMAGMDY
jgi:chaperonin GroEL (HSP60 family)